MRLKAPHKYYMEKPRARSESPFAKGGRVRPEDFISVRRQRSTSCGYNSDGSDSPRYYESRPTNARHKQHSHQRSEISFFTEGDGKAKLIDQKDAAINTNINLYNNVLGFMSGDTIAGTIDIEIGQPFEAQNLLLEFNGQERCHIGGATDIEDYHREVKEIISMKQVVVQFPPDQ